MIYKELFKAILMQLLMRAGFNLMKPRERQGVVSDLSQTNSVTLNNNEDRSLALQVLRLSTISQFRQINSLASTAGESVPESKIIDVLNITDQAFENKKPAGQLDGFIEEWTNSAVLAYVSQLAPAWVVPIIMMVKSNGELRPTLVKLLKDYTDSAMLSSATLSQWKGLQSTVAAFPDMNLDSIRQSLLADTGFATFSAKLANYSVDANHYLPFRMLTNWLKYESSIESTVNSLRVPSRYVSLTPLDAGQRGLYLRQPVSPISEPMRRIRLELKDKT